MLKKLFSLFKKEEKDKKQKKDVMVVRTSRKVYFMIYFLVIVTIIFLISVKIKEIPVNTVMFYGCLIICIFGIKFTELSRLREKYEVNPMSVIYNKGLINIREERVDLVAISEVIVHQNLFQRMINVGDIKVLVFSKEGIQSAIRNVSNPKKIANLIEQNMKIAKRGQMTTSKN